MKRNKKIWSWTRKQRSHRNENHTGFWGKGPTKDFRHSYIVKSRGRDKKAVLDELKGVDGDFSHRTFKNQAKWDWW